MPAKAPPPQTQDSSDSLQRLLKLINELNVEFISILDLDDLIERVAKRLKEVIDYRFFNLFLCDEARGVLISKKSIGYHPQEASQLEMIPFDRSIAAAAARERRTIIVNDVRKDSRYLRVAPEGPEEPLSEIAVPLILTREQRVVGVLTIESAEPDYFTTDHERILGVLSNQLAVALEHARLYDELRERTREMRTLIEIGHEITAILDLDRLLDTIAPLLRRVIPFDFLMVGLVDEEQQEFVWYVEDGYGTHANPQVNRSRLSVGIVGRAVRERRTFMVDDVSKDPDYDTFPAPLDPPPRSELAVPLIYEDRPVGVIALESRRLRAFNESQARLLENIANHLSIALVNARLHAEHVERERLLEHEVLLARDVQRAMIPEKMPPMKGFEIAARLEPALNLSGDFYDYVRVADNRLGLMIGDVAGKGIRAAMGMAAARSILRSVARRGHGPGRILRDANLRIHRDLGRQLLVTLVYGMLDTDTRTLQYCNAGHNAPILIRASGKWRPLKAGGLLLGVFDKQNYKTEAITLERGDLLFFYTDGLVEAHTPSPERLEFGEQRLLQLLLDNRHLRAGALADTVLRHVNEFTGTAHQHDDVTLLVIRAL